MLNLNNFIIISLLSLSIASLAIIKSVNVFEYRSTNSLIDQENSKILAFKREKKGQKITFLGNFSSNHEQVINPSVGALDYASAGVESKEILSLEPWSFRILVEK